MATKPKPAAAPTQPEPFKPMRFMFADATGSEQFLCLGTEELGPDSLRVPDAARGKIALCFGTNDYGEFVCEGHLTRPQVEKLIAFLMIAKQQLTLEAPIQDDGATIIR